MSRILTAVAVLALATSPVMAYSGGCRMASNTAEAASADQPPGQASDIVRTVTIVDVPVTGSIQAATQGGTDAVASRPCGEAPQQAE
jgi:hypothetical protein